MDIQDKLQEIINKSLKTLGIEKKKSEILIEEVTPNEKYTTNIAISLSNTLHKKPEEIAEILKQKIKDDIISDLEINYPGTIHIYIQKEALLKGISQVIEQNLNFGKNTLGKNRQINIELIDNNPIELSELPKLYKIVYIDNLSRILKSLGFKVTKNYHITDKNNTLVNISNDIKIKYNELCFNRQNNNDELSDEVAKRIYKYYKDTHKEENINYFKKELIDYIFDYQKKFLDQFRINFDNYSNTSTETEEIIDNLLEKLNKSGNTYLHEDSLLLKTSNSKINLVNPSGVYNDLLFKISHYITKINNKYDGIIEITQDTNEEINQIKEILEILKIDNSNLKIEQIHLPEQMNNNEILHLNSNTLRYILSSSSTNIDIYTKENTDNPMYYIEKTNSKIYKILSTYNKKITKVNNFSTLKDELAYIILNKLFEFEKIVIKSGLKQQPNLINKYVYELSQIVNNYLEKEQIITEDETYTNERLNLLLAIKIVLNNALDLIGIISREDL